MQYHNRIIELLKRRVKDNMSDEIDWKGLSENRNAISILEQNIHKIHWKKAYCIRIGI